jgi:WD40 repeat protein
VKTRQSRELLSDEIVHAVALSADGRWMATGSEQKLRLWVRDENSWHPVADRPRTFNDWHNAQTLAFSRDGSFLVSGTGDPWGNRCALEFWSVPDLKSLPGLLAAPRDVSSLAFSRDGRHLVTGSQNGRIRVWDLMTMTERGLSMRVGGFVADVEFSPTEEDVFASAGADRNVRLWSLSTGGELVVLQGPTNQILALSFSDDGRAIFTVELGGRIATWDTSARRRTNELIASDDDRPDTLPLGFSADSAMLATIDETGELRYWDLAQRRELKEKRLKIDITGLFKRDLFPVISRDLSTLAIGTIDGTVQLWHLPTATRQTWRAHARRIRNVAISPDGKMLSTIADDSMLKLWNIRTHTLLAEILIPGALAAKNASVPLVWSSDGQTLAIASDTDIMLHDTAGRLLFKLDAKARIFSLRFSPDDRLLVSGQRDRRLAFWDPQTGALLDMISTKGGAHDICFSPDGRTLVTVVDQVKLWSVATRQEVSTLRGHNHNIFATLFSPNGNHFVTADFGGAVRLWSALPFEAIDVRGR